MKRIISSVEFCYTSYIVPKTYKQDQPSFSEN